TGDAKSVVGVLGVRREARSRRAAADLHGVAPRAAAGGAARAALRPPRVVLWRGRVIAGGVPVATPLVNVLADVVQAVAVRRALRHRLGTVQPPLLVAEARLRRRVSPRKTRPLHAAARRALPLRLGREAERTAQPCA